MIGCRPTKHKTYTIEQDDEYMPQRSLSRGDSLFAVNDHHARQTSPGRLRALAWEPRHETDLKQTRAPGDSRALAWGLRRGTDTKRTRTPEHSPAHSRALADTHGALPVDARVGIRTRGVLLATRRRSQGHSR